MIPEYLAPIANHLWQSTLFAAAVGLLTLALRNNRAAVRYALWLAASAKFLIPFSLLVAIGGQFEWHPATAIVPVAWPVAIDDVIAPPVIQAAAVAPMMTSTANPIPAVILTVWALGFVAVLFSWWRAWRPIRAALRHATPLRLDVLGHVAALDVRSTPDLLEPAVVGVLRPVLLLPDGIANHLQPSELQAVLVHEMCHIRRRDNLAAMMHMLVEALFWFHPLVWWLEVRLVDERERACDEEVLRSGNDPAVYAESILKICRLYVLSSLACASGVSGANLRKRVEEILANRLAIRMNAAKIALLSTAAAAVIALPFATGAVGAPRVVCNDPPTSRYVIKAAEVYDTQTHLTWQRCSIGQQWKEGAGCVGEIQQLNWDHAVQASSMDWRLPTRDELSTLVSPTCSKHINEEVFPGMGPIKLGYWTRTRTIPANNPPPPWWDVLYNGEFIRESFPGATFAVRLVRHEQSAAAAPSPNETAQAQTSADVPLSQEEWAQKRAEQERPRTAVPFDPKQFDKYVGFYQVVPYSFLAISRQGEHFFERNGLHFFSRGPNQPDVYEIYPESPTKFFTTFVAGDIGTGGRTVSLQISFMTDAKGNANELVLHQGGFEQHAPKVDESVVRAAEATQAERIKNNTPSPGTEAWLRRYIEAWQRGQPDYEDMAPRLSTDARGSLPGMLPHLQKLGALKTLTFKNVNIQGVDVYEAGFDMGHVEYMIAPLMPNGKVAGLSYSILPTP